MDTPESTSALPANALRPSLALENVPAPAYVCDARGRITGFNERAASLWGRRPALNDSAERYCGSEALLVPEGSPLPHDSCATALAIAGDRAYQGLEAVVVRPDGSRRTVLCYATPLHDDLGAVCGASAVLIDVTEHEEMQRAARAALRHSEANFRSFFDNVAVGAAQANADGRFIRVNDRYCEITGYSREELLTMTPFDLDCPEDRETDVERVLSALNDPAGVYHTEKRYVRKDGTKRWVHVAVNFVRDSTQRTIQSAAIVLDISERKRAEEALQQADRLKDDFLATLAHELRNPLAPLKSAAELLRRDQAHEFEWCREVVDRQVAQLARLIDDLLDVSRITRDRLELRRQRIELADVIRSAIEASRPALERRGHTLISQLPADPVCLDGDLVRLTQVFTNLLTNAAKFTQSPGSVRVVARRAGASVRIAVEDTGVGIASDDLPRIFEKFYQCARDQGGRFPEGLGIGLSLARRLVELHGGRIEARSAGLSFGSEFIVWLPLAEAETEAVVPVPARPPGPAPVTAPAPERERRPRRRSGMRIMIVDDNVDGADALGRLLEVMGHEAVTDYDGPSALERSQQFRPDIVFLDLGMAGMDGFEVCRRLREQVSPRRPKIVALTGWGGREDLARTGQAGFDAHLVKPVARTVLERLLLEAEATGAGVDAAAH